MATFRLQKFLSAAGVTSRRKAEELIKKSRVKVNGIVVTELGTKIDPDKDKVVLNQKVVTISNQHTYIMINKPKGYITTVTDPQRRSTVIDLIPEVKKRLYPIGRLDQNTTGLLILTDDGELAYRLTHPKFGVEKTYEVEIKGRLSHQDISKLEQGIELEGKVTSEAKIKIISTTADKTRLTIKIHEGRKRQVRFMFQTISCSVINLKRIEYGGLKLNNLEEGKSRYLSSDEIVILKRKVGLENDR